MDLQVFHSLLSAGVLKDGSRMIDSAYGLCTVVVLATTHARLENGGMATYYLCDTGHCLRLSGTHWLEVHDGSEASASPEASHAA